MPLLSADGTLTVTKEPLFFVAVRAAIDLPGGWRLNRFLQSLHRRWRLLDRCTTFDLGGEEVVAPLYWPRLSQRNRLLNYEHHQVREFARAVDGLGPCIYVDCGADIGLFARLLLRQTNTIRELHAIEPNPISYQITKRNLPAGRVHRAAVSDFIGSASLVQPTYSDDSHAKHIIGTSGETPVITIDSLDLKPDFPVAVKMDVEGEELAALRGAERTLRAAPAFAVQVEANRDAIARTGIEAIELVRFLRSIRDVSVIVVQDQDGVVATDVPESPFFDRFPSYHSCDIIAVSR